MPPSLALAVAVLCFLAGASCSRIYISDGRTFILVVALLIYTAGNVLMVRLIREIGLGVAMSLTTVAQLIAINAIAVAFFGERPAAPQLLGIALGVVAVALILIPPAPR